MKFKDFKLVERKTKLYSEFFDNSQCGFEHLWKSREFLKCIFFRNLMIES